MSGDWQVGDLALCVVNPTDPDNPTHAGQCYKVQRVWINPVAKSLALDFENVFNGHQFGPSNFWGHTAARFRKIKPDTEPCEAEFTALIKRMKPAKVKA